MNNLQDKVYKLFKSPTINQINHLTKHYKISPKIAHMLALPLCGIDIPQKYIVEDNQKIFPRTELFVSPAGPDIGVYKPIIVANKHNELYNSPYKFNETTGQILFFNQPTGLNAVFKSFIKNKDQSNKPYYIYSKTPIFSVTVNPLNTSCQAGCTFCLASYVVKPKKSPIMLMEQLIEPNKPVTTKQVIALLAKDPDIKNRGGLKSINRIALVTTRLPEHSSYVDYAIELGQVAQANGFTGEMFFLTDHLRTPEQFTHIYNGLTKQGIKTHFAYTVECIDDEVRKRVMPKEKGKTQTETILDIFKQATNKGGISFFSKVGAFYVAGLEHVEKSIEAITLFAKLGVKPHVHGLNPAAPGIAKQFHTTYRDKEGKLSTYHILNNFLKIQTHLLNLFNLTESISDNVHALVPHHSYIDKDGILTI